MDRKNHAVREPLIALITPSSSFIAAHESEAKRENRDTKGESMNL